MINPKQSKDELVGTATWYPYYAGFSSRFADEVLRTANLQPEARVLDPWNGAGTTTCVAAQRGYRSIGLDLNPAMLVAARARILSHREAPSLFPLMTEIVAHARTRSVDGTPLDPVAMWFTGPSRRVIRAVEGAIQHLLVDPASPKVGEMKESVVALSDLAAFYYVALFRTVRELLGRFVPSNPTWTKLPNHPNQRLRPDPELIFSRFEAHVAEMRKSLLEDRACAGRRDPDIDLLLGDSAALPLPGASVDFILSSPPYCTRIDYAVATMPELAILGYHPDRELPALRRKLIGNATVPAQSVEPQKAWGGYCLKFLEDVANHSSKASKGYYHKNHVQYFSSIYHSLEEIARVIAPRGRCVLVAQDSYYKDVHNDLPSILQEMLEGLGLIAEQRNGFVSRQNMANIHPHGRRYRASTRATESVITLYKAA